MLSVKNAEFFKHKTLLVFFLWFQWFLRTKYGQAGTINRWMDGFLFSFSGHISDPIWVFHSYIQIFSILYLTSEVLELFVALKDYNNINKNHFNLYCANAMSL